MVFVNQIDIYFYTSNGNYVNSLTAGTNLASYAIPSVGDKVSFSKTALDIYEVTKVVRDYGCNRVIVYVK